MSENDIKRLLRQLRLRYKEYILASLDERQRPTDQNRYFGIATGTKWAIEDIEKLANGDSK